MDNRYELMSKGYVIAVNNIHSLPGEGWYAAGSGKPTAKFGEEIRLIDGQLSVWKTKYYKRPDGSGFIFPISGIVEEFSDFEEMVQYLKMNGRISEPGLPAYLWGD
jgi:hypothetical protein